MSTGRSHFDHSNGYGSGRYRTHDRDELLQLVLEETGAAAEREQKLITREFDRRRTERVANLRDREVRRRREIFESRRREKEQLAQARARRKEVRREIEEDDLRLSGQWPPPHKQYVGPFDTSEFGARAAAPTTDEWVASELTMASVERRLGIHRITNAKRSTKLWIGAVAAAVLALAATLIFAGGPSRADVDTTAFPISAVSLVDSDHPTSTISFRASAPIAARRHSAESSRSVRAAIGQSPRAAHLEPRSEPIAESRRSQPQPLDIDLSDADNLWGRGSE